MSVVPLAILNVPVPVTATVRAEPRVKLAVFWKEPPLRTRPAEAAPKLASAPTERIPPATVSGPVKVFVPLRTKVPRPSLVKPAPESAIAPLKVVVSNCPATSIVGLVPVTVTAPDSVRLAAAV